MRNHYSAYFDDEILSASPLRLVCLLYGKAVAELRNARQFLASKNVGARVGAISKACDILAELTGSLDLEQGGETARRLQELYAYSISRLMRANLDQADEPIAEVLGLLITLHEGWEQIAAQERQPIPAVPAAIYAQASDGAGQSWSFSG